MHIIDLNADARPSGDGRLKPNGVHIRRKPITWDPRRFSLYKSEQQHEGLTGIHGMQIWNEIRTMPLANANMLDYWMRFPNMIPRECYDVCTCFFGTHYVEERDRGDKFVRCLFRIKGEWTPLDILLNGFGFSGDCRVALYE